ncbi:hypothetical protein INT47_008987 [Mucor saturninus]|uniref:Uncharacterized protein n=1 Tax=Mucor saturninus TaxID=64648 RepID=A0A8H7UWL7_9FUNG|nr:hypothetical protein INT47_008987 [Mucor saturninus]
MDNRQFYHGSQYNTPSPVVFPSASPTPKLYSTPTKKLPEVQPWQGTGIESVPINHHDLHNEKEEDYHQHNHDYSHYNSREKSAGITPTISPLSMMMESDTLLDDEDISSYRFSEEDLLSSILSSRSPSLRPRPVSFTSSSPQEDEEHEEGSKPIVGSPFAPVPNQDPIIERPSRFSLETSSIPEEAIAPASSSKISFGKNLMSRMKKAASGKPFK